MGSLLFMFIFLSLWLKSIPVNVLKERKKKEKEKRRFTTTSLFEKGVERSLMLTQVKKEREEPPYRLTYSFFFPFNLFQQFFIGISEKQQQTNNNNPEQRNDDDISIAIIDRTRARCRE